MKTPEDEAFDDIARRQGDWGGGFEAKRKAVMDKINADFDEEYIKYRVAFPKEYTAAQVLEDQAKYGASWSQDGKRIDPMSVYKEPDWKEQYEYQKRRAEMWIAKYEKDIGPLEKVQPAQEPVQEPHEYDWSMLEAAKESLREHMARIKELEAALSQPAQEPVALVIDGVLVKSALPEKYTGHLYTAPPQRELVGLTDEEKADLVKTAPALDTAEAEWLHVVRAAEQSLKEKNT